MDCPPWFLVCLPWDSLGIKKNNSVFHGLPELGTMANVSKDGHRNYTEALVMVVQIRYIKSYTHIETFTYIIYIYIYTHNLSTTYYRYTGIQASFPKSPCHRKRPRSQVPH